MIIGPRIYYAMANDGLFFKFAKDSNNRFVVPGKSIITQAIIAIIMIMIGSLEQLLVYIGFALNQ